MVPPGPARHVSRRRKTISCKRVNSSSAPIARDPRFAQAYKALAANYVSMALDGFERPTDAFPQANRNVGRAFEIDPELAEAHAIAAAIAFFFNWDWVTAERESTIANELPSGALPTQELVGHALGRWVLAGPDDALRVVRKLRLIDPLTVSYAVLEADYLFHAGQLDAAATLYETDHRRRVNCRGAVRPGRGPARARSIR